MADVDLVKIQEAIRDVMREEMKAFYIDREEHYQHHQFVKNLKSGVESCQSIVGKVTLSAIIAGAIILLIAGIGGWVKKMVMGG